MQLETSSAAIIVDGKALEEYDVVVESPTKVTCWVASEEGKSFSVQWKCHEELRVTGTDGRVRVDGTRCGHGMMYPGTLGVKDTNTFSWFLGHTSKRGLMFGRVQLSDDDSLLNKKVHKDLGEISLQIKRGEINRQPYYGGGGGSRIPVKNNNLKLHERSKKSIAHCTVFGPERDRKRHSHVPHFTPNSQATLTFVFKYRPFGVLQANGIAPRPPQADGYAAIEPARLNDRIRNLEDELKHLRYLQASNSEDQKPNQVKREDPREEKRPLFAPGEVIDLT